MADLSFDCSIRQGFNFEKDAQVLVGHLLTMKIGDTELTADTNLTDPEDNTKNVVTLGPIANVYWQGGYADPIVFTFNVSTKNQTATLLLTHTTLTNTLVEFKFKTYAFDQVNKVYYPCYHSGDDVMKGIILKEGGELSLDIGPDPENEVPSPLNYSLSIAIMPQQIAQAFQVAVSLNDKFSKVWGVEVTQ
ncbi:MAG: hypothetical protein GQ569_04350 [Methylococcaceae bacterium]|nr:hypothetical protein [Methylococcaceae bacterium]